MNKTILITGGTGKLGQKFVEHFSEKKWTVIFTTTKQKKGADLLDKLNCSDNTSYRVVDLLAKNSISDLLNGLRSEGITVNHLVNNARNLDFLKTDSAGYSSRDNFMNEYLLDVVIPYELSIRLSEIQPEALESITNIGSQYGIVASNPNLYDNHTQSPIQYNVAKAALNHLTRELAVRLSEHKIRVNCIAYGGVEGRARSDFKDRYASLSPNGRMLEESEVAGPLDFLTSTGSSAVTGHTLIADGGWTIW
ncbi:SDR family oxidoreductase [Salinibius halmophilus]|uniref:SDR family oxidoreductase n=1 Tax=Salinibius halmophilus TaxID=1853216 RepID=UPI000E675228|nr:SDR family oxidoreductase [Salinibius halmophilus]